MKLVNVEVVSISCLKNIGRLGKIYNWHPSIMAEWQFAWRPTLSHPSPFASGDPLH